jgi:hypothetical protein
MPVQKYNLVDIVTVALKEHGHTNPTKWCAGIDVDAVSRLPFPMQRNIVTDLIYSIVGPVMPGVCTLLGANKPYEDWLLDFETHVAGVMVEHSL